MEKVQITMNLPKELLEQLKGEAKRKGMPLNTYLIMKLQEIKIHQH